MANDAVGLRTEPLAPDKSMGELVSDMTESVSSIFRKEIELAKVEIKEEISHAGKGAGMLGGAAIAGWLTLLFLSFAAAWVLDEVVHTALAFLIVALVHGGIAALLAVRGRQELTEIDPLPETRASLKEDVEWARAQRS